MRFRPIVISILLAAVVPSGASPGQRLKLLQPDGSPWPASALITLESARGLIVAEAIRVQESSSAEALVRKLLEVRIAEAFGKG